MIEKSKFHLFKKVTWYHEQISVSTVWIFIKTLSNYECNNAEMHATRRLFTEIWYFLNTKGVQRKSTQHFYECNSNWIKRTFTFLIYDANHIWWKFCSWRLKIIEHVTFNLFWMKLHAQKVAIKKHRFRIPMRDNNAFIESIIVHWYSVKLSVININQ